MKRTIAIATMVMLVAAGIVLAQEQGQRQRPGQRNAPRDVARPNPPTHRDVKYGPQPGTSWTCGWPSPTSPRRCWCRSTAAGSAAATRASAADCWRNASSRASRSWRSPIGCPMKRIAPAQFLDSARAIQFIRSKAKEWNLDPTRIAATGGSAGAGISLWLGFHDDLADPKSEDPVLRQSTRLTCMAVYNGQTSYDPRFIRELFPGTDTYKHPALAQLFDVDLDKLDDLPKEKYKLFEECFGPSPSDQGRRRRPC